MGVRARVRYRVRVRVGARVTPDAEIPWGGAAALRV